jgi:hypothetical protein
MDARLRLCKKKAIQGFMGRDFKVGEARLTTNIITHSDKVVASRRYDFDLQTSLPKWPIVSTTSYEKLSIRVLFPAAILLGFIRVWPVFIAEVSIGNVLGVKLRCSMVSMPCQPIRLPLVKIAE